MLSAVVLGAFWLPSVLVAPSWPLTVLGTGLTLIVVVAMLRHEHRPLVMTAIVGTATSVGLLLGLTTDPMIATAWCLRSAVAQRHKLLAGWTIPLAVVVLVLLLTGAPGLERLLLSAIILGAGALLGIMDGQVRSEAARSARLASEVEISRDLHDTLGRRLALMRATAGTGLFDDDAPAETLRASLSEVEEQSEQGLRELQRIVRQLRTHAPLLAERGLREEVDAARAAGLRVRVDGDPDALSPRAQSLLAPVLHEMLTNALRHATTPEAFVAFSADAGRCGVAVRNPAPIAEIEPSLGLLGMRERLLAVGGHLRWESTAGTFHIQAEVTGQEA